MKLMVVQWRECEMLVHGERENKPFPHFHKLGTDAEGREVNLPVPETDHPYKCGRSAMRFKVSGTSFYCYAVLCKLHAEMARREGFHLEAVEVRE